MNVVGLGKTACNIAKEFQKYPQYKTFFLNSEKLEENNFFLIPKQDSHELYEESCPDLSSFSSKVDDDVIFIVNGGGTITGSVLRILEKIKDKKITIIFLKPEEASLTSLRKTQNKVVFNILQEYTRSGLFERMFILELDKVEEAVTGITILNRIKKINEFICDLIHTVNIFENTSAIFETPKENVDFSRIYSIGIYDFENNLEKMFFSLDNPKEFCYYYNIPMKTLEEDTEIFKRITNRMKEKTKEKECHISYSIYGTHHQQIYSYVISNSHLIQKF